MEIDKLQKSVHHTKIAVFLIAIFLLILAGSMLLLTRQLAQNTSVLNSKAAESSLFANEYRMEQDEGDELMAKDVVKSVDQPIYSPLSVSDCARSGGHCLEENYCRSFGGNIGGECITNSGSSNKLYCCNNMITPFPTNGVMFHEECGASNDGSRCMSGNECSKAGGRQIGTCWDGGIGSVGVCCNIAPPPTSAPLPTVTPYFSSCMVGGRQCFYPNNSNDWVRLCGIERLTPGAHSFCPSAPGNSRPGPRCCFK